MKRLALVTAPLLIFVLMLGTIGCEKKATPAPGSTGTLTPAARSTATPAVPAGELKIAISDLGEENPDPVFNAAHAKRYLTLMYDHLVGGNDDGTLSTENGVAYKWEHSADYKSWTFYLREGVKFHNGDDLTAEDVKFSLQRLGTQGNRLTYGLAIYSTVQEIVVDSPYQVTVRLKNAGFFLDFQLSPLMLMEGFVYPKKYFEANGQDYFRSHPIGSGPYRFAKQVVGSYITFEALDNHWSLGVPRYKTVTFYKVPEEITRIAMLKNGEADVIDPSRAQAPELQKAGFNLVYSPTGEVVWLGMHSDNGASNPVSDRRVREALVVAIDSKTILDTLFQGQGEVIASLVAYPFSLGSVPLTPRPYDPERAKHLLKEAGYPDAFSNPTITIHSYARAGLSENAPMLEAIASYWIKVGVKVKIVPTDFTTYRNAMIARTLGAAVSAANSAPTKLQTGNSVSRSVPPGAWAYLIDPPDTGFDALVDQQLAARTLDEYNEVQKKISQYNYDNVRNPAIFKINVPYAANEKGKGWNMGYYYFDINARGLVKR